MKNVSIQPSIYYGRLQKQTRLVPLIEFTLC